MKKRDFRPGWSCRCTLSTQFTHNAHCLHILCTFLTRLSPRRVRHIRSSVAVRGVIGMYILKIKLDVAEKKFHIYELRRVVASGDAGLFFRTNG
jgi:hypothetical protein